VTKLAEFLLLKRKMENKNRLKYYIDPNSKWKILYEVVHTWMILYSIFAVPLIVGFNLEMGAGLIFFEAICLIEQIVYPILVLRTPQFAYGILTLDKKILYPSLLEKGFVLELFALVPFNLLLGAPGIDSPRFLVGILRLNRAILIRRLPA